MRSEIRDDLACLQILWNASKSFAAASLLLPPRALRPTAALYAFCRVTDNAVDHPGAGPEILHRLRERLHSAYAGRPQDHPVDRAFARAVTEHRIPLLVSEALLEGYLWDLEGRRYETLPELRAYCARVASTVGIMMTLVLGRRERSTLARACDLGMAMQLTNVARDVGEDARQGRMYLPRSWLREEGLDPDQWLAEPRFSPGMGRVVSRLLGEADTLYRRAERGIPALPREARLAIASARYIYADIGRVIAQRNHDSVSGRAFVTSQRKLALMARSATWLFLPAPPHGDPPSSHADPPSLHAEPPLPESAFLVDAISPPTSTGAVTSISLGASCRGA